MIFPAANCFSTDSSRERVFSFVAEKILLGDFCEHAQVYKQGEKITYFDKTKQNNLNLLTLNYLVIVSTVR